MTPRVPRPLRASRRFRFGAALLAAVVAGVALAHDDEPRPFPFTGGFHAPELARTASTILLLWDPFAPAGATDYEVRCDGAVIARTEKLCHLAIGLTPERSYRFVVVARDARGAALAESEPLVAATKPAGATLDVQAHGARGDGKQIDTAAIQCAIDACPPGGTVLVPAGVYRVGHLELKSDLTLRLARGATLRFLGRGEEAYPERAIELSGPDGPFTLRHGALITGVRTDNVALVGEGTIEARGETWWTHGDDYRPKVLNVVAARNLLVQGITIVDPPTWNVHPIYVDRVAIVDVSFLRRAPHKSRNGDALDLDSCRDALVAGCTFANQDDSIALKSGRLSDTHRRRQRPVENVMIRDCRFDRSLGPMANPLGIALGSENCGQIRRVWVRDCVFRGVASLMNIKTNRDRRQALVEDVLVERCDYGASAFADEPWNRAPISLDAFYYRRPEDPDVPTEPAVDAPFFRQVRFRDITIDNPLGHAVYISGLAERALQNVAFTRVAAKAKRGIFARNIDGLVLEDVAIEAAEGPAFERGKNVSGVRVIPADAK